MSRFPALAAAVAACLALAGCGSIPTSGPVELSSVALPDDTRSVQSAAPPTRDSNPTELVRDFLAACRAGAFNSNFDTARQYLTSQAAAAWQPQESITLFASDVYPQFAAQGNTITMSVPLKGTVSKDGVLHEAQDGRPLTVRFTFERDADGQWRIASLPAGLLLARNAFTGAYSRRNVYFLAPDLSGLVPDVRWVPNVNSASFLIELLLEGPSEELARSVASVFPTGSTLQSHTVTVQEGQAQVKVASSGEIRGRARALARWQVEYTLSQISSVRSVSLSVNDQLISEPAPTAPAAPVASVGAWGPNLVNITNGKVVASLAAVEGDIQGVALAPSKPQEAAVLKGGHLLWVNLRSGAISELFRGDGLVGPVVDRWGWTWVGDARAGNVVVVSSAGVAQVLEGDWRGYTSLSLSKDGVRMVAGRSGQDASVDMLRVRRDSRGEPRALEVERTTPFAPNSEVQVGWRGDTEPAALVRQGDQQPMVWMLPLGDEPASTSAPDGARFLAASQVTGDVLVSTDAGELWQREERRWRQVTQQVIFPTFSN